MDKPPQIVASRQLDELWDGFQEKLTRLLLKTFGDGCISRKRLEKCMGAEGGLTFIVYLYRWLKGASFSSLKASEESL
ncbi:hypothetical protein JTE90_001784 [Oedothorax gibbosus]|uniref:Uncharacterized protein n=1 Tax=Oedothorax gibbosus TaxID=931172 RepID=A0AAV6VTF2_9ARAC|nr:hypothetical protein JTE90_001784 [Oedothorax gibbosus]